MSTKRFLTLLGIALSLVFGIVSSFFHPSYTISSALLPTSLSLTNPVEEIEAGKVAVSDIEFHGDRYCSHNIEAETSDPSIRAAISHDNKLVFMGDKVGTFDVAVYAAFDKSVRLTQTVKITKGEAVDAGAEIQREDIAIGEKTKIDWYVYPYMDCVPTFLSSDSSIVSVDENGIVTGLATGSASVSVSILEAGFSKVLPLTVTNQTYASAPKAISSPKEPSRIEVGKQFMAYGALEAYGTSFEILDSLHGKETNRGYVRPFYEGDFTLNAKDLNSDQTIELNIVARKKFQRTLHPCLTAWTGSKYEFYYVSITAFPEHSYFLSYGVGQVYETYLDQLAPSFMIADIHGDETPQRHFRPSEDKYLQTEKGTVLRPKGDLPEMTFGLFYSYPLNYRYIQFYNTLAFGVLSFLAPLCLAATAIWTYSIEKRGRYIALGTLLIGLAFPFVFWPLPITLSRILTYYVTYALVYAWHFCRFKIFYRTRIIDDEYHI